MLLIAIDLILLISPGSFAFLFRQNNLKVVISFGIAFNFIYLLNIFANFSYIKEFSFCALNTSFKHIPGIIKSQLTALSLAASLKEFFTSSFVIIKLLLLFLLI